MFLELHDLKLPVFDYHNGYVLSYFSHFNKNTRYILTVSDTINPGTMKKVTNRLHIVLIFFGIVNSEAFRTTN
jgi:hypothetical protein